MNKKSTNFLPATVLLGGVVVGIFIASTLKKSEKISPVRPKAPVRTETKKVVISASLEGDKTTLSLGRGPAILAINYANKGTSVLKGVQLWVRLSESGVVVPQGVAHARLNNSIKTKGDLYVFDVPSLGPNSKHTSQLAFSGKRKGVSSVSVEVMTKEGQKTVTNPVSLTVE